ncbi:hypothetical protein V8C42DRAFT_77700 [Trichoderma barbatum]
MQGWRESCALVFKFFFSLLRSWRGVCRDLAALCTLFFFLPSDSFLSCSPTVQFIYLAVYQHVLAAFQARLRPHCGPENLAGLTPTWFLCLSFLFLLSLGSNVVLLHRGGIFVSLGPSVGGLFAVATFRSRENALSTQSQHVKIQSVSNSSCAFFAPLLFLFPRPITNRFSWLKRECGIKCLLGFAADLANGFVEMRYCHLIRRLCVVQSHACCTAIGYKYLTT